MTNNLSNVSAKQAACFGNLILKVIELIQFLISLICCVAISIRMFLFPRESITLQYHTDYLQQTSDKKIQDHYTQDYWLSFEFRLSNEAKHNSENGPGYYLFQDPDNDIEAEIDRILFRKGESTVIFICSQDLLKTPKIKTKIITLLERKGCKVHPITKNKPGSTRNHEAIKDSLSERFFVVAKAEYHGRAALCKLPFFCFTKLMFCWGGFLVLKPILKCCDYITLLMKRQD